LFFWEIKNQSHHLKQSGGFFMVEMMGWQHFADRIMDQEGWIADQLLSESRI